MISSVTANRPTFKDVDLSPGFNVILAERTQEAETTPPGRTRKSTNGSGKTLLLEICQFCLGADITKARSPLNDEELAEWEFTITLRLRGKDYRVSRSKATPGRVIVQGDFRDWVLPPKQDPDTEASFYSVDDWVACLGSMIYGLALDSDETKFRPSFRILVSYAIRRSLDAYGDPFAYFRGQRAWQRHVANAYFLGLDWTVYQRGQALRLQEEDLKKAVAGHGLGSRDGIGDLETRTINLERRVRRAAAQLESFRVHPQYHRYETRASDITTEIHSLISESVIDRETVAFYEDTVDDEAAAPPSEVDAIYDEAGLVFPGEVRRQLDEAQRFHDQLIRNRQTYLTSEIQRLRDRIGTRHERVEQLSDERASVLLFLREHGALEEFTRLQLQHSEEIEELGRLRGQIDQLKAGEEQLTALRIELEQLRLQARTDLDNHREAWTRVVELFGEFTAELYQDPGELIIDIGQKATLKLGVEIERAASQGVQEMTVFCYDLAVATALAERGTGPGFLFHDSTIFDGVDPRQKAAALRLAARQAAAHHFQYLICLNVGDVPWDDLGDWDLRSYVRRELTDVGDGGLLGIRY